jgi:hypothetical protein
MTRPYVARFLVLLLAVADLEGAAWAVTPGNLVAPNSLANVEGSDNNGFPFWPVGANPPSMRYQQVYASSEFASLLPAGALITHIAFRGDAPAAAFSVTIPSVQVNLSTTTASPDGMSTTFANNVGPDDMVAFGPAPLPMRTPYGSLSPGPKPFDAVITLDTPFYYNPARGNLLLDVRSIGGNTIISLDAQDLLGDAIGRQYSSVSSGNLNSPTASTMRTSLGLVTQFMFEPVPEPATFTLVCFCALASVINGRRLR